MPQSSGRLVLLRGLARSSDHWGSFLTMLRDQFPEWKVIALDLPGSGVASGQSAPLNISETARLVLTQLQGCPSRGPTVMIGMSLGAMVITDFLEKASDEIQGAVLMNTSFKGVSPFYHRLTMSACRDLLRVVTESDALKRETRVLKLVSNRDDRIDASAKEWAAIATRRPVSRLTFIRQLIAASRYKLPSISFKVPVLILNSEKDRMVAPSCSARLANKLKAELRTHPTAGHDITHDAGEWVIDQLKGWMRASGLLQTKS